MFFLAGPTAIGKSEIAVAVAERCDAEILGADAFQVYAGLDLLTAKPGRELRERVRHHLIGEIPLGENFDAARYRDMALERVREIEERGKRVLVVGGTGLYLRALTHGLAEMPKPDPNLRAELEALSLEELQARYAELDPVGMKRIDMQNPRRLVRAIEVCELAGVPFSSLRADWNGEGAKSHGTGVLLERDREELYKRIDGRVLRMFDQGVIEEVRSAGAIGMTASQAIGLAEIRSLIRGEISRQECVAAIQIATRRYAKRQLTWLRRENIFFPIQLSHTPFVEVIEAIRERVMAESAAGR